MKISGLCFFCAPEFAWCSRLRGRKLGERMDTSFLPFVFIQLAVIFWISAFGIYLAFYGTMLFKSKEDGKRG